MPDCRKLAASVWPAVNMETMLARAWSESFKNSRSLKFEDYRQIVNVVMMQNAFGDEICILGQLTKMIAGGFKIDPKTVTDRICSLKLEGYLEISVHPNDGRKKLVKPTEKLVEAFKRYSAYLVDIQQEFGSQLNRLDRPQISIDRNPNLYFDLIKEAASELKSANTAAVDPMLGSAEPQLTDALVGRSGAAR